MRRLYLVGAALALLLTVMVGAASATHAPENIRIIRFSAKSVTVGWNTVPGVTGYGLYVDGARVSTAGPSATQAKFGTPEYRRYVLGVQALKTGGQMSTITVDPRWVTVSTFIPPEPNPIPAPSVTIISAPSNPTTATDATFAWSSRDADSFTCKLDASIASSCSSPKSYAGLNVGSHTFTVVATGPGGTAQASSGWTIEAVTPPPPPGSANIWVDTNGGACSRSATSVSYSDGAACGSFAAAYSVAVSGDLVGVAPGGYPNQFFAGGVGASQGSGTKAVTYRGIGGIPVIRQIHSGSDNLTFDNLNIDAGGQKTSGAGFENGGGENNTFKNGRIGNISDEKGALVDGRNFTFDNVVFHDVVLKTNGVHLECLMALWNQGMVIRNSIFTNCAIMAASIGIGDWWQPPPPPYDSVTLEGNTFGTSRTNNSACCAVYSLAIWSTKVPVGSDYGVLHNWIIRNNFIEPGSSVIVRPSDDGTNIICGNTGNAPSSWKNAC